MHDSLANRLESSETLKAFHSHAKEYLVQLVELGEVLDDITVLFKEGRSVDSMECERALHLMRALQEPVLSFCQLIEARSMIVPLRYSLVASLHRFNEQLQDVISFLSGFSSGRRIRFLNKERQLKIYNKFVALLLAYEDILQEDPALINQSYPQTKKLMDLEVADERANKASRGYMRIVK